ncbi:MAG: hypothetical protein HZB22_00845, partial [Deltaproteobacteria bacterium]|nr:hypothetical protein [Deltaproteobacteria bacterium]
MDTSLHVEDSRGKAAGSFNGQALPVNERGRTLFEALLTLILVSVFLLIAIDRYASSVRRVKEVALTVELNTMRSAINYFAIINGRLPESLKELTSRDILVMKKDITGKDYTVMIIGKYVESMS